MFSGKLNLLKAAEEIYIGMLEPGRQTVIDIKLKAPSNRRYVKLSERVVTLAYEVRYNFLSHSMGQPIEFSVKL